MAVVRSLFGRFSRDASSVLKVADNIVCLSDHDRVVDNPVEDFVLHDPHDTSDLPEKFNASTATWFSPRPAMARRSLSASGSQSRSRAGRSTEPQLLLVAKAVMRTPTQRKAARPR